MEETLFGERIKLCRPRCDLDMAGTIFNVVNKCIVVFSRWLEWTKDYLKDDAFNFLKAADANWNDNKEFVYAMYLEDTFIGVISILNVSLLHKRAEIGYWQDTDYTGNGCMTEAVKLIEKELFDNGFNKIVIQTDVLNIKSAKIPQNLGYKLEGILRQDAYSEIKHCFWDRNVFSKLRKDYIS